MWNSIDQLQKKIYHDKAKKVRQQPAEKSQSQSTRVTRRSARLRKTEKSDKHENIDSEDSSEKTDSDEEVNGQELENDSSSPEDDTPLIHLKDDSPPPKVPKKEGPRAEELNETEPKILPEVKLKKTEDNDRVEDMKIEKSKTENHKTKPENQTQKRKSPSPTNETVQNGDEKRTDANSNQEKQLKHCNLPGCENVVISNRFGHYCSDECNVQFVSQCFRAFVNHRPTSAKQA